MGLDDLLTCDITGKKSEVKWEERLQKSVPQAAREQISRYFEGVDYNSKSIYLTYQIDPKKLGFWDKLFNRNPVFEDWISENRHMKEISITSFSRTIISPFMKIEHYLADALCVRMTFMFGSHYNGNCIIDSNLGSTRIGRVIGS